MTVARTVHAARLAGVGLGLAAAVVVSTAAPAPPPAAPRIPPDFVMPKAESSPGPVTFRHATHRLKVARCSRCHMRDLKMHRGQSGPITLEAKMQGQYCGACHDGKSVIGGVTVFPIDECDRCHAP